MYAALLLLPLLSGQTAKDVANDVVVDVEARVKLIQEVRVPAKESGALVELDVAEGDLVKAGQVLGTIDDQLVRIERQAAQLEHDIAEEKSQNDVDLRYAQKSLAVAKAELGLSLAAVDRVPESISQSELDRLRLVVEKSALSIEQAQRERRIAGLTRRLKSHTVEAAEQHLRRRQIIAPIDGMVVQIGVQPGEWLNPGDPVLRIIQLDRLRVEVNLDGARYGAELQGQPVQLQVAIPPDNRQATFRGEVTFVSPEVQPVTGQARVWAELDNSDLLLRPGVHGKLTITLPAGSNAGQAADNSLKNDATAQAEEPAKAN